MKKSLLSIAAAAVAGALLAVPVVQAKEIPLKGISAWPKNFPLTPDFLRFIEFANKAGAGQFKIAHIGGPEISKAPAQAKGFKSGLYDLMFTAASYHRGVVPEVDALSATMIRPWDARKSGAMDALNMAVTKRLDGIILSQTATSVSFVLYLSREPERSADGMISLKGFKMRSVPIYDGFLRALGATTVTVQVPEIYNALERGLVDGFAFPELFTRPMGWPKFVKYRVYPRFYQLEPCRGVCAVAFSGGRRCLEGRRYGSPGPVERQEAGGSARFRNITATLSGDRPRCSVCRHPAGPIGAVGRRTHAQPVSRYGTAPTSERIRSARPARAWASAMAIITASASPTRVFILASPRM